MSQTCTWTVTRGGVEQPCDRAAVAYSRDPRPEYADEPPFPVCAAHTRIGYAVPLTECDAAAREAAS